MRTSLTIGEFATLSHLSVRTLRRYHETGLLEPAAVDPFTGYRYYSAEQIPPAQVIRRLRDLDVPLAEVKAILATGDPQRRAELITGHLLRLEGELDRTKAAVMSLRQLLHPGAADLHVELRSVPPRTVAAISSHVRRDEVHRIDQMQKQGEVAEDDAKRGTARLQKITESQIERIDALAARKESEVMEV